MKLLHLSDLHIGKRVYGYSMLEDQRYILRQIVRIAEAERPDAVLLAGDLYDKQVPPAEAVGVLDDFLTALRKTGAGVFLISGNHDSPERLSFGASLMEQSRVYVSRVYRGELSVVTLTDAFGPVDFYLMPFLKPAMIRQYHPEEKMECYTDAVQAVLRRAIRNWDAHPLGGAVRRRVLLAHQFVTGASRSESEEISVGGADNVDASAFQGFDYVALGHIHGPQNIKTERIRYCGTPLKYSFSEAKQSKSVSIIHLGRPSETPGEAELSLQTVLLSPRLDLRDVCGTYMEVTAREFYSAGNREDYVRVILRDEQDIPGGIDKLRTVYPNLMKLEYDNRRTRENRVIERDPEREKKTPFTLFSELYEKQNNASFGKEEEKIVRERMEKIWGDAT